MGRREFEQQLAQLIRQHPETPRPTQSSWFWHLLTDRAAVWLYLFAGLGGLVAFTYWVLLSGDVSGFDRSFFFWAASLGSIVLLLLPFYGAWERYRAIRVGRLGWARVINVHTTVASARGEWEVSVDRQRFTTQFVLFEHWAPKLYTGTTVRVLVHPSHSRVMIAVGP